MALSTFQYNRLMHEYEERRYSAQRELTKRQEEVYGKIPRIKDIQDEIASMALEIAKNRILNRDNSKSAEDFHQYAEALKAEKEMLLKENGYDPNYIKVSYICSDCKDTGYIGNEKCHCLKDKIIDILYEQSNMKSVLERENFKNFDINLYSSDIIDDITNETAKENIKKVLQKSKDYVNDFGKQNENLLLFGPTGVGKTFLTNCIAKEIMDRSYSVIYVSAIHMFDMLADSKFSRNSFEEDIDVSGELLSCDLLIIDDLGTELVNSFTASAFFNCINERYLRNKSVIISTNLSIGELKNIYSERVFSRITSNYNLLKIFGKDLRFIKSLGLTN